MIYTAEIQRFIFEHYADKGPKWVHEHLGVGTYDSLATWACKHGLKCSQATRKRILDEATRTEEILKAKSIKMREFIRKERIRYKAGLPTKYSECQLQERDVKSCRRRMLLRKRNYIIDYAGYTAYYDEETDRSEELERRYTNFTFKQLQ